MAIGQPRNASLAVAVWLLACLCSAQAAPAASGPPALPLALHYQGRHYALNGDYYHLELPVGCPGAGALGVQHRVPPLAARCSAALSVIPAGTGEPVWRSEQVGASFARAQHVQSCCTTLLLCSKALDAGSSTRAIVLSSGAWGMDCTAGSALGWGVPGGHRSRTAAAAGPGP